MPIATVTESPQPVAKVDITSIVSSTVETRSSTDNWPLLIARTGMPSPSRSTVDARPPRSVRNGTPTMKAVPIRGTRFSIRRRMSSALPPRPIATPAAHTQAATPKLALPVSTTWTGTAASAAAIVALPIVPDIAPATWIETISVQPRSTSRR